MSGYRRGVFEKQSVLRVLLACLFLTGLVDRLVAKEAVQLYVENDSRWIKPNHKTDRHYTHGTKLVYLTQPDWECLEDFSQWWNFAEEGETVDTAVGYFLGQHIYTPDHVSKPWLRSPEDRKFAGWLYVGLFAQRATDDVMDHVELNVGVIGPSSQAQQVQEEIHDLINSDDPIGWEDQIGDEPAADFIFMRQQRIMDGCLAPTESTDVITEYGFTAGSVHRHLQAGVTFRYGQNLGKTFIPGRLELPAGVSSLRDEPVESTYLFTRFAGRAIEHNRFLTGLDPEPFMGEFQVGAVYKRNRLEVGYSQTFYTQEFEEQSGVDSIGALTVSWAF